MIDQNLWTDLTVCIATIPERKNDLLPRAIASVNSQILLPQCIKFATDTEGKGAKETKNEALAAVRTDYVTFLDDDDEMLPNHIDELVNGLIHSKADVVYTWPDGTRGIDPAPDMFGRPFSLDLLLPYNKLPTVALFRTERLRAVGGFQYAGALNVDGKCPYALTPGAWRYDDWGAYLALYHAGATFHHRSRRTWIYHQHPGQTAGVPQP